MKTRSLTFDVPCPERIAHRVEQVANVTSKVTKTVARESGRVFSVLKAISKAGKQAIKDNYKKDNNPK